MFNPIVILGAAFILCIIAGAWFKRKKLFWPIAMISLTLLTVEIFSYCSLQIIITKTSGVGNIYLTGPGSLLNGQIRKKLTEWTMRLLTSEESLYRLDYDLGYVAGRYAKENNRLVTNSASLRSDREYSLITPDKSLRLACFGDSVVFCDGEHSQDCWTYYLENMVGNLEVLNFGVSYNGLGQSYLRFLRDGLKYDPDIAFFNYVLVGERDDYMAHRILRGIPLNYTEFSKVHFEIKDGTLVSTSMTPLKALDPEFREKYIFNSMGLSEQKSFWSWMIFNKTYTGLLTKNYFAPKYFQKRMKMKDGLDLALNLKLLENLLQVARRNDIQVVFFVNDNFDHLPEEIKTLLTANKDIASYYYYTYVLMLYAKSKGVHSLEELLNETNHFNPKGSRLFTEVLGSFLTNREWRHRNRTFYFDHNRHAFIRKEGTVPGTEGTGKKK